MEKKREFVVMAKPVGSRCNMACAYCYYLDKGKYSLHETQTVMSAPVLEKLIRQTIKANPGPVVSFVWHGGEPSLAGVDFYKKVVELEKKYLPRGWQAWNNLQTNGLLLDEQFCTFLKENRFDVGVSIDGSRAVHDTNRKDRGGNGTWERVRAAVERLKAVGVMPDLLCTVNSASLQDPEGIYDALKEMGTGWIQFIPIVVRRPNGSISPESVSPEGYGQFLCRVFDRWLEGDVGKVNVQLFSETARVWKGGKASLCWMQPTCGRALIAEEDGRVYSCDHFVDDGHRIGSLYDNDLKQLASGQEQTSFGSAKRDSLTAQCRRCEWLKTCNGACPKDRFGISQDGEEGQYYLCEGLKMFFSHAKAAMKH